MRKLHFLLLLISLTGIISAQQDTSRPVITRKFSPLPGEKKYKVDVTITSPSIGAFARYRETLPEGATVNILDPASSTSNFVKGKLKFIWTTFPPSPGIHLVYEISGCDSSQLNYLGEFSYLKNDLACSVFIGKKSGELPPEQPAPLITRTFEAIPGTNTYEVTIVLKAVPAKTFVRYEETLPGASYVKEVEKGKSDVRVGDGYLKYIWVNFPDAPEVKLKYLLRMDGPLNPNYEGTLDYLSGNTKEKVLLLKENISFKVKEQ